MLKVKKTLKNKEVHEMEPVSKTTLKMRRIMTVIEEKLKCFG